MGKGYLTRRFFAYYIDEVFIFIIYQILLFGYTMGFIRGYRMRIVILWI